MNADMVTRLERSFDQATDAAMASVVVRLNTELADAEQQLAEANLRLAELALTLRLAIYRIPSEARKADPGLDADIKRWIDESAELIENPDQLLREAEEKTRKFLEVTERLEKLAAQLKERNDAKKPRRKLDV